jgi:mRNA interferase HicA
MSYHVFMKAKQFLKKLKYLGVEFEAGRGKGGHYLARYQGKQTTVPVHGDADISPVFMKIICKQLGINPKDL